MLKGGYNLGGEPSGHIILSDYATTGDGFVAALQVLAVVQKLRRPVSEVCHRFDPLPQILKNVRYRSGKPLDDADVKSAIVDGEKRLNGHGRLLVRSSGTEPVIRVMGEGDDRILVEEVVDHIVNALGHAAAPAYLVLIAISVSHFLNDTMQSLIASVYPILKDAYALDFAQIGMITLAFQFTASLLQPAIAHITDKKAQPFSLAVGMGSTFV